MDHLHSAGATTIPVDSFRRNLRLFLYEGYFVWLLNMYCRCAGCAHLCLGLRSLGCCSLLGSRKLSTCRSPHVSPAICGCVWWARVCLYPFALPDQKSRLWFRVNPLSFRPRLYFVLPYLDSSISSGLAVPGPSICPRDQQMRCMFSCGMQHALNTWINKLWCNFFGMRTSQVK